MLILLVTQMRLTFVK